LVTRERGAREIAWEPGLDEPPVGVLEPSVPLLSLGRAPRALPPARPYVVEIEALAGGARDPFVRRLPSGALTALGRLYAQRGDEAHATALFQAALGVLPDDGAAATNLAVMLARAGNFERASALVEAVLAREPDRVVTRVNAGRYRLRLGDLDGAEAHFRD